MTTSHTSTQDPQEPVETKGWHQKDDPRTRMPSATGPATNGHKPDNSERRVDHLPAGALPAVNGHAQNNGHKEVDHISTAALPPVNGHQHNNPSQEVEDGNLILYRTPNFFLRTANRPGQKPNPLRRPTGYTTVMPRVMPHQEKRIAASETRLMPSIAPINPLKKQTFPLPSWLEAIVVVISLFGSFAAHAYNMFNFPRYELDEGTYVSNAWAITQGLISPYPYGYGHPPLGWIQIATWIQLTGGFFTFGNALNSSRVPMLLYAVGCSLLVYLIVRRLGGSRIAGLLALVIFSFSPLSITYQRQVFLDNIATFWLLLSIYLLVIGNSRLFYIISAAICFALSALSKEVFLIALPVMIYASWLHTTKFQRKFALVAFTYAVIALCSGFVLMAVLKGELFPYVWHLPWDTHPHLSMLDTFFQQTQRSQANGSFITSWTIWIENDPVLISLSIATILFNLIAGWKNRKLLMLALFSISFWLLLVRGGQVLSFYIIPLIPMVALNTAMALQTLLAWLTRFVRLDLVRVILIFVVIAAIIPYDIISTGFRFYQHPTATQTDAMVWVRNHIPHSAFIVINSYLYVDLHVPGGAGVGDGPTYPHAEVYWNVATDPVLHDQLLQNNWDRIDYIVADSEMLHDIQTYGGGMDLIKTALQHSVLRAEFRTDDHNLQIVVDVYQVIHKFPASEVYVPPANLALGVQAAKPPAGVWNIPRSPLIALANKGGAGGKAP